MDVWARTDAGCVRAQNQDAVKIEALSKREVLTVVCDGMGGAKSGNVASSLAVDVFTQEVKRNWKPSMDAMAAREMLCNAVKLANFTVFDQANQFEEFSGMGTTLVAALVSDSRAVVVNVGDSRMYCVNDSGITQITKDHSLVQVMVDRGELTPEAARTYPGKNFITRAVGTEAMVQCDTFVVPLTSGDCLLSCTDGLSNMMDSQEILFEVLHGGEKQACCQRLLDIVKDRGAPDNVTCTLVAV